jgi:hypothetical protein
MPAVHSVLPGIGWVHRPSVAFAALLHVPPQHAASWEHESPSCVQYDDGPHVCCALQSDEQQSPFAAHGLPSVLHVSDSGTHLLLVQLPLQHSPGDEQVPLSAVHCVAWHTLPTQLLLQQSVPAAQEYPAGEHIVVFTVHAPVLSHMFEQHCAPDEQESPNTPHGWLASVVDPELSGALPWLPPHATSAAATHTDSHSRTVIESLLI